jgi:hypothetical protein
MMMSRMNFLKLILIFNASAFTQGCTKEKTVPEIEQEVSRVCGLKNGIAYVDRGYSIFNKKTTLSFSFDDHGKLASKRNCVIKWSKKNNYIFQQVPFISD